MAQYIDKAAVVAEIEKRKNENLECAAKAGQGYFCERAMEDIDILSFIDTLEVKEMDLNPEYVRKDAFVEKAEEFIYSALNDGIMGTANIEDFMRLFKKHIC